MDNKIRPSMLTAKELGLYKKEKRTEIIKR